MKKIKSFILVLFLMLGVSLSIVGCSCGNNNGVDLMGDKENLSEESLYKYLVAAYQNKGLYNGDFSYTEKSSDIVFGEEEVETDTLMQASFNGTTKEGYLKSYAPTLDGDSGLAKDFTDIYIVKENDGYTNYYTSKNAGIEYSDVFYSDENYLKNLILDSVEEQEILKDVNPKEYTNVTKFSEEINKYIASGFSLSSMNVAERKIIENAHSDYYYKIKLVTPAEVAKDVTAEFIVRYNKTTITGYSYEVLNSEYDDQKTNKIYQHTDKVSFSKNYDTQGMDFNKSIFEGKVKGQLINVDLSLTLGANDFYPFTVSTDIVAKSGENVYDRLNSIIEKYSDEENVFQGWYRTSSFTNKIWPDEVFSLGDPINIYGKINRNLYEIDYAVVGVGKGSISSSQEKAGKNDNVSVNASAQPGYEISSTYYIEEGKAEKHYFVDSFTMPKSKVTVYVEFDTNIKIHTKEELEKRLPKYSNRFSSFVLCNDIDLQGMQWYPVGTKAMLFRGKFDGNGFTISNYKINYTGDDYIGFFGVTRDATIKNLALKNYVIDYDNYFTNEHDMLGGLIGYAYQSFVENCYVDGSIETVSEANKVYVGGLIGYASEMTISKSYSLGTISVLAIEAGVGGLIGGSDDSDVRNNYSLVDITVIATGNDSLTAVGGFIGIVSSDILQYNYAGGDLQLSANNIEVTGNWGCTGGFIGAFYSGAEPVIAYNYATGNVSVTTSKGACAGGFFADINILTGAISDNNYRYSGQSIISQGASGSFVNEQGTSSTMTEIWQMVYSNWDSSIWNTSLSENPRLK